MATNTFDPHGDDDLTTAEAAEVGALDGRLASNVIRAKLEKIYAEEPSATEELAEAAVVSDRSQHQQFMYELSSSGKDLATIQTEWHAYYQSLPDHEKQIVWQEFYASQTAITGPAAQPAIAATDPAQTLAKNKSQTAAVKRSPQRKKKTGPRLRDARTTKEVQATIRDKVSAGGKLDTRHHLQSLLFGLGMGAVVIIIFLFGFFNEVVIAPFIQPSRVTAATPLIVSSNSVAPSATPEVIIPKINVEIPVIYDQPSADEDTIQKGLESGVVHYPTTVKPGQTGNAAFFGHSSNNIFNKGKYKFAFVLLRTLQEGDTFYLTYSNKVYVYKVITKKVVDPSEVGVLGAVPGQTATATLITCDPPGTTLKRLVIIGQQISPDPAGNAASTATTPATPTAKSVALPGNGPTLLGRFIGSGVGKAVIIILVLTVVMIGLRQLNKRRDHSTLKPIT